MALKTVSVNLDKIVVWLTSFLITIVKINLLLSLMLWILLMLSKLKSKLSSLNLLSNSSSKTLYNLTMIYSSTPSTLSLIFPLLMATVSTLITPMDVLKSSSSSLNSISNILSIINKLIVVIFSVFSIPINLINKVPSLTAFSMNLICPILKILPYPSLLTVLTKNLCWFLIISIVTSFYNMSKTNNMLKTISSNISINVPTNLILVLLLLSRKPHFAHINLITLFACSTINLIITILSSNVKMKNVESSFSPFFDMMITNIVVKSSWLVITPLIDNNLLPLNYHPILTNHNLVLTLLILSKTLDKIMLTNVFIKICKKLSLISAKKLVKILVILLMKLIILNKTVILLRVLRLLTTFSKLLLVPKNALL